MVSTKASSTGKPSLASLIAGAITCAQVSFIEPSLVYSSCRPATLPGMPAERIPECDDSIGLPSGPRYMSRLAAAGAVSRKSRA